MVIDVRPVARNSPLSKISPIRANTFDEGGMEAVSLLRKADKVEGSQNTVIGVIQYVGKGGKSQIQGAGLFNVAGSVNRNQVQGAGFCNYADDVGHHQVQVIGFANQGRDIGGEQIQAVGAFNYTMWVENQTQAIGLANGGEDIHGDQFQGAGILNYRKRVGKTQTQLFGGLNFSEEVGRDQIQLAGIFNDARNVGGDQIQGIGLANIARSVGGSQYQLFGGINYAHSVKGQQGRGFSLANIQTRRRTPVQSGSLFRWNPTEKLGVGSSAWKKIERANTYLAQLETQYGEGADFYERVEALAGKGPSITKRITKHWTFSDILARQARRRLKKRDAFVLEERVTESQPCLV